ncbi:hypothetical protein [Bradyrhizobium sp. USDA 3364]
MIGSYRAFLAIAALATTASVLGAPPAQAHNEMHFSRKGSIIHSQERLRLSNRHLQCSHQAPPQRQVADPFADMILG